MRTVNGFFGEGGNAATGYVLARVRNYMPPVESTDITFRITTGSPVTVLFDDDLRAVIYSLLPATAATPAAVMAYMRVAPTYFEPQPPFWSPAGRLNDIFRIKGVVVYLPSSNGTVPTASKDIQPVYGGFSARFLAGDPMPERSILGRDALARIKMMIWAQPHSISFRGV
jgi:hypothetical protein